MLQATMIAKWADAFTSRHERSGRGTVCPTVRQAARRFRVKQREILECVDGVGDLPVGFDYFGIAVGMRVGSGIGEFDCEGDYLIETSRTREADKWLLS